MVTDDWKKLNREMKILIAKQAAGGFLHPKDKARLAWLQERLGEAEEVKRISVDEPVDSGPKTTTSDDHYATELSEELLRKAERQKLNKFYEKENVGKQKRAFEARDYRKGSRTFKQEGLSNFAIEASDDMREGELGLADVPGEEEQAAQKMDLHRAVYAQDESERLTKKAKGKKSNPYALDISDGLTSGLDKYASYEDSSVPDHSSKSFAVDDGDAALLDVDSDRPVAYEEVNEEVEVLLRKSYDLPKKGDSSRGAKTTFDVTNEDDQVDVDLVQQAVQHAEADGLVDDEHIWAVDDDGNEATHVPDQGEINIDLAAEQAMPQSPPPPRRARFSDEAPTTPGVAETYDDETKDYDLFAAAIQAEEHGRPSRRAPDNALIPEPPDMSDDSDGVLIPEPPDLSADSPGILIPDPPQQSTAANEVLIPDPPAPIAEPEPYEPYEPASADEVPDLSDDEDLSLELVVDTTEPAGERGADLEADQFWGLSDSEQSAPKEAPPPAPPPKPQPVQERPATARPPRRSPAAVKKRPAQPLPAFSFSADKVVPVSPPPKPRHEKLRASVTVKNDQAVNSGSFLNDLFDDASTAPAAHSGGAPVPFVGAQRQAHPPGAAGKSNDLSGPRRATVHFKDGVTRRGVIGHIDTDADTIRLEPAPGSDAGAEDLVALSIKAIFLLLPRGTAHPESDGIPTRISLIDGRKLEGSTPDYDPRRKAFTLFPKDSRGNTERVIVFNDAIKNIWFEDQ